MVGIVLEMKQSKHCSHGGENSSSSSSGELKCHATSIRLLEVELNGAYVHPKSSLTESRVWATM